MIPDEAVFAQIVQRLPGYLIELDERGIAFVSCEKTTLQCRVLKRVAEDRLKKGILSDELVELTVENTRRKYDKPFRRVRAGVEVNGVIREMAVVTNSLKWSARTVADLYKARWTVEMLFKELKQTLQLQR